MSIIPPRSEGPVIIVAGPRSVDPRDPVNRARFATAAADAQVGRLMDGCRPGAFAAVWHGDARGADQIAWSLAHALELPCRGWRPDWQRHGKSAGVRRTADMLGRAPAGSIVLVAAPRGVAPSEGGTAHTVRLAEAFGIPVVYVSTC